MTDPADSSSVDGTAGATDTGGVTALVPGRLPPEVVHAESERLLDAARAIADERHAAGSREAYRKAWTRFAAWCEARGHVQLPADPATVVQYATAALTEGIPAATPAVPGRATGTRPIGMSTLYVHLAAITAAHVEAGQRSPVPALKEWLKGARRKYRRTAHAKEWIDAETLETLVRSLPTNRKGLRDRAILLVTWASGGRRRSETAAMRFEDLQRTRYGYLWTIPRSKSDQEGEGVLVAIRLRSGPADLCPMRALGVWLAAAGISEGWVFRPVNARGEVGPGGERTGIQPRVVADIVKEAAARCGLDPRQFAAHSLRSGFATEMARAGVGVSDIAARMGHRRTATTLRYVKPGRMLAEDDPIQQALDRLGRK